MFSKANVLGDFQTFTPNTDGLHFITVDAAQTLPAKTLVANLYLSYAKDYFLVYTDYPATTIRANYKDQIVNLDGTMGYSFTKNLQMFVGMTALLSQTNDSSTGQQVFASKGVHSFRPGLKWRLAKGKGSEFALLASTDILNTTNNPYTGNNAENIFNVNFAWSGNFGGFSTHGFNLGYRKRTPGTTATNAFMYPLKDQMTASYGYSYPWSNKTRLIYEIVGCAPVDKGQNGTVTDVSCLELLAGFRHRLSKKIALGGGFTLEAPGLQTMAPAWRAFVGANLYLFSDDKEKNKTQPSFLIVPEKVTILPREVYPIPIAGGVEPYQCTILEGDGAIELEGCTVKAFDHNDTAIVQVKDSTGQTRELEVSILEETSDLTIEPKEVILEEGESIQFQGVGGKPSYQYKILEGGGTLTSTGHYKATGKSEFVKIQVQDKNGNQDTANVTVQLAKQANQVISLKGVNFVFNTTDLVSESIPELEKVIAALKTYRIKSILVQGHTDDIGNADVNTLLSQERANSIAAIIKKRVGISSDKIKAIGYGKERPIVANVDANSRLQNRRVELAIYTE